MSGGLERGQATTELALGSLVFITVLMFGIHFGEAGYAMMKAKEAAQFAMHDAEGRRTHWFSLGNVNSGNTFGPFNPSAAGAAANARYAAGFRGVFTQLGGMQVSCRADRTVDFGLQAGSLNGDTRQAFNYLRNRYENRGGVSCRSEGRMSLFGIPTSFADGNDGFFKEPHARYTSIKVCGAGMPVRGNCTGKLATLTGDWAFEGPAGSDLNGDVISAQEYVAAGVPRQVQNDAYEKLVHDLFDFSGGAYADSTSQTPAQRMLQIGGGLNPGPPEWFNETRFAMSYKGERGSGVTVRPKQVAPRYNAELEYQTSGADLDDPWVRWDKPSGAIAGVPRCFLGLKGCASP